VGGGQLETDVIEAAPVRRGFTQNGTNAPPLYPAGGRQVNASRGGTPESSCNIRWPASLPAVATLNTPRLALGASATWTR